MLWALLMTTILNTIEAPPRYIANDPRPSLIGMTRDALADALEKAGVAQKQRRMRAGQIWHWLYHRGVTDFAQMTNIAKELRQRLDEEFIIGRPEIVTEQVSNDGTRKWLLRLAPDDRGARHEVEMVYIPEADRGTLCISSQVGCTLTCTFCHTGTQKLVRNLSANEIVAAASRKTPLTLKELAVAWCMAAAAPKASKPRSCIVRLGCSL